MKTITVDLGKRAYPILIGNGLWDILPDFFAQHAPAGQYAIVSHPAIYERYGKPLAALLSKSADVSILLVPDGEPSKSLQNLNELYTSLLENRFERSGVIIALGGGVIGDLAGFLAATFLRGVRLVQMPTSLLAQVDSSIGGKTGINHPLGKNLIGAFKQPRAVISDVGFLKSLPHAEIRSALGEVIKYGFIGDPVLFEYLETHLDQALAGSPDVLQHLVEISAAQKARVVAEDEREGGLRMILNFGHTFGHALENEYGYGVLKHGEAVILGMQCALEYGRLSGITDEDVCACGQALLQRIPISYDIQKIDARILYGHMALDKKVHDKNIRLILLESLGKVKIIENAQEKLVLQVFDLLKKAAQYENSNP